ncbi:MAG TPA: FAD-dependent oxidoreductase [Lachnospiraceae bacterium]|nr:FAD-dependent oxidoreductase [Lachnospiraceae bacterium]
MDTLKQKHFSNPPLSYWIDSTSQPAFPTLESDISVDIAVVGGGISGIFTAYLLNQPGIRIAVLEADQILKGTTGHTTAKITSQHGLIYHKIKSQMSEEFAKQYAEANETAIRKIQSTIEKHSIDCDFIQQCAFDYTLQDKYVSKIQDEVETASSLGIKATYLDHIPLPFPVKAAVRFDDQAQFHPRKFLLPIAEHISKNGVDIYEHTRIVDIEDHGRYTLTSKDGRRVSAEKVIIASHYPFYNKPAFYFARIYPERSYVVAVKAKENYPGGMYITAEEPGRSLRSQITDQGELILVGGEHHKTGQGEDMVNHYEKLIDFACDTFTVEDIPYRWSTQDCMTLDDIPFVGHFTAKSSNIYIATGYGKWGMTNSIASAMLLSDLILKGSSPWQDVYSPSRHTVSSSAKNFVVENMNVAGKILQGKFAPLPDGVYVIRDEAKIYESNGQRYGAYRDMNDILHVIDTTCPHMGCELFWNSAEKTWDCPCHGSRFTYDGDIIDGPAIDPLNVNRNVNPIEKLLKDKF